MEIVPFTSDPSQTFDVVLGETKFTIAARYNDEGASWTFDLALESDGLALLTNVPLLIGEDMLGAYALGYGGLVATDLDGAGVDAGADDLGSRVVVTWFSEAELAAIRAAGATL